MSETGAGALGPSLADLLAHNVVHFAGKTALRLDDQQVSFGELARRVDELVQVLGRHVAPGERVALWLQNSFAWLAAFLALNALGAVSVPVNTRLTGAELRVILGAARPRALITSRHYRGRALLDEAMATLEADQRPVVVFDASDDRPAAQWPVFGAGAPRPAPEPASAADLLCIQYTSGTTAIPKGVMLTNHAYVLTASYVARCQRLTPSSRFISAAPFFHCSGTMHAITTCLVAGCTLNAMSAWDPERFLDAVERQRCDVSHMVYYRDVLALGAERARGKLASMKVSHDLGTRDYLMRVHDELGIDGISNIYGMTETAGQFTMWFPDDPLDKRVSGNGRPQPGNALRIGDPDTGAALPPGATGEIQMRGATVTPGYFEREDANAAAFTADGWLRSGDLGRIDDDGDLVYVARLKELIRVGGENLAPAEVEEALRQICRVQQVCVLAVPDARLDEVPAAVVVGANGVEWPRVVEQLRERLAGFKIPRAIYIAAELPVTATNRVQRAILREWIADGKLQRTV